MSLVTSSAQPVLILSTPTCGDVSERAGPIIMPPHSPQKPAVGRRRCIEPGSLGRSRQSRLAHFSVPEQNTAVEVDPSALSAFGYDFTGAYILNKPLSWIIASHSSSTSHRRPPTSRSFHSSWSLLGFLLRSPFRTRPLPPFPASPTFPPILNSPPCFQRRLSSTISHENSQTTSA